LSNEFEMDSTNRGKEIREYCQSFGSKSKFFFEEMHPWVGEWNVEREREGGRERERGRESEKENEKEWKSERDKREDEREIE